MMRYAGILIGGIALFVGVFLVLDLSDTTADVVITRTHDGFEPESVTIKKGDSVVFVSETGVPFWPASDSHPSHGTYASFDPKGWLQGDESWTFVFERAGIWKYHDHLAASAGGVINVLGERGESAENCVDALEKERKAECWSAEFAEIIENDGIDTAFEVFKEFYRDDPVFRDNCHDVTHYIGDIAYKEFSLDGRVVEQPETAFCGYGFYHGFIEAAFAELGTGFYEKGEAYCEFLGESTSFDSIHIARDARSACYHGMGHAAFDSTESQYWGSEDAMSAQSLRVCEQIFDDEHRRKRCSTGVFNALANSYGADTYGIVFDTENPAGICSRIEDIYRPACYAEVALAYINNQRMPAEEAAAFIHDLKAEYSMSSLINGFIDLYIRHSIAERGPREAYDVCTEYFSDPSDMGACILGSVTALVSGSSPGSEHVAAVEFCELFKENEVPYEQCNEAAFYKVRSVYTDTRFNDFCASNPQICTGDRPE